MGSVRLFSPGKIRSAAMTRSKRDHNYKQIDKVQQSGLSTHQEPRGDQMSPLGWNGPVILWTRADDRGFGGGGQRAKRTSSRGVDSTPRRGSSDGERARSLGEYAQR